MEECGTVKVWTNVNVRDFAAELAQGLPDSALKVTPSECGGV